MPSNDYYLQIFHEIKNSVTLINSYLQLIEKKFPEITSHDYWSTSRVETARLRSIVTEISQVKPHNELHFEQIDLTKFITECCNGFQCYAEVNNLSFSLNIPDEPLFCSIDRKQLHHVFSNLFKNACESMQHQGQIEVSVVPDATDIKIHITDTGCGIAPTVIDHIFDLFVTTKEEGSGLGLNIAKQIITAHHGTISVISQEGEGTTFTITLPYQDSNINI